MLNHGKPWGRNPLFWGFLLMLYYLLIMTASFVVIILMMMGIFDPGLTKLSAADVVPKIKEFIMVLLAGLIGASITSAVHTYRRYRLPIDMSVVSKSFLTNLSKPITGGMLAIMTFFVLKGGLLGISINNSLEASIGFGFLIGFATNHAIQKLYNVIETIFNKTDPPKNQAMASPKASTTSSQDSKLHSLNLLNPVNSSDPMSPLNINDKSNDTDQGSDINP